MSGLYQLFVYGTLMRGEANAHLMIGARFVGQARTVAAYQLRLLEGYPALLPGGGGAGIAVKGELYLVDQRLRGILDELEGHPTLFRRQSVALAGGTTAEAYLLAAPAAAIAAPLIPDGDWRGARRRSVRAGSGG